MFNTDEKASFIKKICYIIKTNFYYHLFFKKKFEEIAVEPLVYGIENIVVYGPNIHLKGEVKFLAEKGSRTHINSIKTKDYEGRIVIGDNVLIMKGVRISSASEIKIGDDSLIASFTYITDADWHGIYDRNSIIGKTAPVILERNVWVGDSSIICKGVRIGENSIVGAGSVVTRNVPPNVIVAGNPAKIVRRLDPDKIVIRRF